MINRPGLERDLRAVENELRLARTRQAHYHTMDEYALATDVGRVVSGLDLLRETLVTRIQELPDGKKD